MDCLKEAVEKFKLVFGREALVEILEYSQDKIVAWFGGTTLSSSPCSRSIALSSRSRWWIGEIGRAHV